ncbi:hypothetical protein IT774_07725 [Salinimonas marina]|uniref:Uncharacterized protein n=1 Tax=Salinimonas marina TaxID=2785918 RepID=A0A7S9DZU9_9ALTE|nr:hypothetical protein [Salinimonas marina]QPG06984.1 hypothetical protein IT774_07725 [Salinimonas marina]
MKIILEENDIVEILRQHVVSNNLLNLADKDFDINLEIDGTNVTGSLDTSTAALAMPKANDTAAPKAKRTTKRRKAAEPEAVKVDTPEKEAVSDAPEKETEAPEKEIESTAPAAPASSEEDKSIGKKASSFFRNDDTPPFKPDAVDDGATERKSLFN